MIITSGMVFTAGFRFEQVNIRTRNGVITEISDQEIIPEAGEETVDASGSYVIPGLTDIHFHGAVGADLSDGTEDALQRIAAYEYSAGVTQICPATMTLPAETVEQICLTAYQYQKKKKEAPGSDEVSDLVGIHLEGPYISPGKVGAQNPAYVQKADKVFLERLLEETESLPKLITIAPEIPENLEVIKALQDRIRFSVGHTSATYEEAAKGFDAGAKHMTHLYNAMPGLTHRAPGPIAAGAEIDEVTPELICDGIHVAPAAVRAAFRLFGPERMILISDSSRAAGLTDGEYELGGQKVYKHDGAVYLTPPGAEPATLASSSTDLFTCMLRAMDMGIKPEDAIRAATYNPTKAIGIDKDYGTIEVGKRANLLLLDEKYRLLRVL